MKKYQMALRMYDFMNKVTSIFRKYSIGVVVVMVLTMLFYVAQLMFFKQSLEMYRLISTFTIFAEFLIFFGLSIAHSMVIDNIKKKNSDLFLYSRSDIQNFANMKKDGYDKEFIRKEIKDIVQNNKSDDNQLIDKFLQHIMTSRSRNKVAEYLKYCEMEAHYDVNV